jgi:hypothetical protein
MNLRRRILWVAASLMAVIGAALWALRGTDLSLEREHPVIGRLVLPAARASSAGTEIAAAVAMLDEPGRVSATRESLSQAFASATGETLDFGLGPSDPSPEIAPRTDRVVELPSAASALLRARDNTLLIVHTRTPGAFATAGRRRGWLGPLAAEVFTSARTLSLAVSEDTGWFRITLALEFPDGATAEAALGRLTSASGDYGKLGFVAQPGYERIARQTRLVVIRLDAPVAVVASHLRRR